MVNDVSAVEQHPAAEPASQEVRALAPQPERLASLDALRGCIMFWIIGGEGLMAGMQACGTIASST
jgi:hypothetical protein